nr:ribulose-phosphate 3-epimerase [Agrococcus sp. ARC_14]
MCADLANLESSMAEVEAAGVDALHVDVLDGRFSPSMPLGLETIRRMRQITTLPFDAHIMTTDNEWFVAEMLALGADSVTFHIETTLHVDRLIGLARAAGAKVGIALNPATSLALLEFVLPLVDSVCLMLINPGYATNAAEKQVPYATEKVARLRRMIDDQGLAADVQVDGRVSFATVPDLVRAGATSLVLGSTSLFAKDATLAQNRARLDECIAAGGGIR